MTNERQSGAVGSRQWSQDENFVCQFLIDTLPIRILSNSFPVNKCARSNRHSSGAHNLRSSNKGPRREGGDSLGQLSRISFAEAAASRSVATESNFLYNWRVMRSGKGQIELC